MCELSIVVSIYNIEDYIDRCIKSLLNQHDIDFEIILIDDGSNDSTSTICEQYANNFEVIKYYKKENGGLSSARNFGLSKSNGEYVFFVDGDDYINIDCLSEITAKARNNRLDILHITYNEVKENGEILNPMCNININDSKVYNSEEWISSVKFLPMAWLYVFKKEFLQKHNLLFFEGIYHEDTEFTPRAVALAERIMLHDLPSYNYVIREGSIMRTGNIKKAYDLLRVGQSLEKFNQENFEKNGIVGLFIQSRIECVYVASIKYNMEQKESLNKFIKENEIHYGISKKLIKSKNVKYVLLGIILKLKAYKILELLI